ncbi:peptidase A22B, signal peptide peptidase [Roridomyces roridus]|uniref:Peptidase A22B, signal peptide peptidase n=1 Tax=Roridomyces roridus TaxID=1738132 RepID=A0AAD7CFN1_9AGAR|nr:peptidase A22B, signal peptide peptidase [Roridomyces roridus]
MDTDLLASYCGLLALASGTIYLGSHASVPPPRAAGSDGEEMERITAEDAWLFPIMGSITLLGLYAVIKYLGPEWISWALGWFFAFTGAGAVWKSLNALAEWTMGDTRWRGLNLIQFKTPLGTWSLRSVSLCLMPLAAGTVFLYVRWRTALLTDVLGVAFALNAISLMKLDSFHTGVILLSGLFFYDVWWVFGTEVMVKVATSLDVPIKLLFPKGARGYTMLGLGDVVVPGLFVALALRYDHQRAGRPAAGVPYPKPFFWTQMAMYVAGLAVTMGVMHFFQRAQPALLFLSPACVGGFLVENWWVGGEAWAWSDEAQDAARDKD